MTISHGFIGDQLKRPINKLECITCGPLILVPYSPQLIICA